MGAVKMPLCCWRSRPGCPPRLGGRRPRRRLFLPPPPEGLPGPTFILFSLYSPALSPFEGAFVLLPRYDRSLGGTSHSAPERARKPDAAGTQLNDLCPSR